MATKSGASNKQWLFIVFGIVATVSVVASVIAGQLVFLAGLGVAVGAAAGYQWGESRDQSANGAVIGGVFGLFGFFPALIALAIYFGLISGASTTSQADRIMGSERPCPKCGAIVSNIATTCVYCDTALPPA